MQSLFVFIRMRLKPHLSKATDSTPGMKLGLNSDGLNSDTDPYIVDLNGFNGPPTSTPLSLDTKGLWSHTFPSNDYGMPSIDSTSTDVPPALFDHETPAYDASPISSDCFPPLADGVNSCDGDWGSHHYPRPSSLDFTPRNGIRHTTENSHDHDIDSPTSPTSQAPRRRNRRRNTADSNSNGGSDTQTRNRERFLERNRVAAAKCRQRKKEWTGNLEAKARDLGKQNALLQHIVDTQRGEIMALKGAVLEHAQCGSLDIEKFFRYDSSQRLAEQQKIQNGVKSENDMET